MMQYRREQKLKYFHDVRSVFSSTRFFKPRLHYALSHCAVFYGKSRVATLFDREVFDIQQLLGFRNVFLRTFDLHKESEGKLIQHDLDIVQVPRLTPLFINDRQAITEHLDDLFHRFDIRHLGLKFHPVFDVGVRADRFFIRQKRLVARLAKPEHRPPVVKLAAAMKIIFLERLVGKIGAEFFQPLCYLFELFLIEAKLLFGFNGHVGILRNPLREGKRRVRRTDRRLDVAVSVLNTLKKAFI
jgi:hypothetical protein